MRIAIVGAGPTGFFLAQSILKKADDSWRVDIYERTPFPFGLVRFGVAPDHPKIKSVAKGFSKTMADPRVNFYGNVTVTEANGDSSPSLEEMLKHYDRIALTVGSQDDRKLGVPNEESKNSFSATRFVGWYNGHPDDLNLAPNLDVKRATIVGAGNVAIDIFRLLISTTDRIKVTDISDVALAEMDKHTIPEIDVLVRRGCWDVAFTNPEVKELLDFEDVQFTFDPPLPSMDDAPEYNDRRTTRNMEVFKELEARKVANPRQTVHFRFQVSPKELKVDGQGQVSGAVLGHNDITFGETRSSIKDSGRTSEIETQLFIRSVGYRGRALKGVPFHDSWGVFPTGEAGRIVGEDEKPVTGLYASGWIRRGPSGVIGTNKKDANEVAGAMMEDGPREGLSSAADFEAFIGSVAGDGVITKSDWDQIDALELANGEKEGRPRRKFLSADEVADALKASAPA